MHMAARALRNPELRRAADAFDRAARAQYGQIPSPSREGRQLRAAARLMALAGPVTGEATLVTVVLIANIVALAVAVAELREAERHAAQAAAAREAATQLRAAGVRIRSPAPHPRRSEAPRSSRTVSVADLARKDVARPWRPKRPPIDLLVADGLAPTHAEHRRIDGTDRNGDSGTVHWPGRVKLNSARPYEYPRSPGRAG